MKRSGVRRSGSLIVLVVLVTTLVSACGGTKAASSSSATPSASPSGLGGGVVALKAYLDQIKPIAADVGSTIDALPGAVKGLSAKPGDSWSTAADNLNEIARQLGEEAGKLQTLSPPLALQPVQDAAVASLGRAQTSVEKMADALDKRAETASTRRAKILAKVDELQTQLSELKTKLTGGIESLLGQ